VPEQMEVQKTETSIVYSNDPVVRENFKKALTVLLLKQPFYASMLLQCEKEFSNRVPTAGVYIKNRIHLIINPDFFNKLDLLTQVKILIHEMGHVIMDHHSRYRNYNPDLFNIAGDIAINQLIGDFPDELEINGEKIKLATINNVKNTKLEKLQSTEYYYKEIYKNAKKIKIKLKGRSGKPCDGDSDGTDDIEVELVDDHSIWEEGYNNKNVTENVVKHAVNKAYKDAITRQIGNLPAGIEQYIKELNKPKLDWKGILRRFVANSNECYIVDTRKRRNRRFGIYYPGTRVESKLNVVEINDTSGSMDEETLNEIYSELLSMSKQNVKIKSIDCDTKVHRVEDFNPKKKPKMLGRGGTDMRDGIKEAMNHQPDCIICFTEGYIGDEGRNPGVPMLWVITSGNKEFKPKFGKVTYMK